MRYGRSRGAYTTRIVSASPVAIVGVGLSPSHPARSATCRDAVGGVVYAALKGDENAMIKMARGKSL